MKPIHLFVPKYRTEEVLEEIRTALETGWTGPGEKTAQFEVRGIHFAELAAPVVRKLNECANYPCVHYADTTVLRVAAARDEICG